MTIAGAGSRPIISQRGFAARSDVDGGEPEIVTVSTVPLRDGSLLYLIGVAPMDEANEYSPVFRRVKQSVQLNDRQVSR